MSKPWMPLYIGDYLRDTRRLTLAQHGAYLLLIMEYWTRGPLPNDDAALAHIVGVTLKVWNRSLRAPLRGFFVEANAKQLLRHKRIDSELIKAEETSQKRALAGYKGGLARRGNTTRSGLLEQAIAKQTDKHSQSHRSSLLPFRSRAKETSDEE